MGSLQAQVLRADNLRNTALMGWQDPYVRLQLGNHEWKSMTHKGGGTRAIINQEHTFTVRFETALVVQAFSAHRNGNDTLIGSATVQLDGIQNKQTMEVQLLDNRGNRAGQVSMRLNLKRDASLAPGLGADPGYIGVAGGGLFGPPQPADMWSPQQPANGPGYPPVGTAGLGAGPAYPGPSQPGYPVPGVGPTANDTSMSPFGPPQPSSNPSPVFGGNAGLGGGAAVGGGMFGMVAQPAAAPVPADGLYGAPPPGGVGMPTPSAPPAPTGIFGGPAPPSNPVGQGIGGVYGMAASSQTISQHPSGAAPPAGYPLQKIQPGAALAPGGGQQPGAHLAGTPPNGYPSQGTGSNSNAQQPTQKPTTKPPPGYPFHGSGKQ